MAHAPRDNRVAATLRNLQYWAGPSVLVVSAAVGYRVGAGSADIATGIACAVFVTMLLGFPGVILFASAVLEQHLGRLRRLRVLSDIFLALAVDAYWVGLALSIPEAVHRHGGWPLLFLVFLGPTVAMVLVAIWMLEAFAYWIWELMFSRGPTRGCADCEASRAEQ